jgi:hypothetical protein
MSPRVGPPGDHNGHRHALDLGAVLEAQGRGESLIAVGANKKPWGRWKARQTERATADELRAWADDRRTAGFAVVTGAISSLVVLDFDGDEGVRLIERLGLDPHVATGRGGYHVRLRHPGHRVATQNGKVTALLKAKWPGLDIRADGGYAFEWGASEFGPYRTLRDLSRLVSIDALPEELAADLGLIKAPPAAAPKRRPKITHPGRYAHLLKIAGAMRGRGHGEADILAELRRVNAADCQPPKPDEDVRALAADIATRYPAGAAATAAKTDRDALCKDLTRRLKIGDAGLTVTGTEVHGQGLSAVAAIKLSNGRAIEVDRFQHLLQPQSLGALVIQAAGVMAMFKGEECAQIAALVVQLAERRAEMGANEIAREWGLAFLTAADRLDIDLGDQLQRWAAFDRLNRHDPLALARANQTSIAANAVVVHDRHGNRLVHSGWYLSHVRRDVGPINPAELVNRMARVGWQRRGKRGRVKATNPHHAGVILLPFYIVPAAWETT